MHSSIRPVALMAFVASTGVSSSALAATLDAAYGYFVNPPPQGQLNNTLRTAMTIVPADLIEAGGLIAQKANSFTKNGAPIDVLYSYELFDPPFTGTQYRIFGWTGFGSPLPVMMAGDYAVFSVFWLNYPICYPGFDNPPDPRSNPMCWWGIFCSIGGQQCQDSAGGYIN